MISIFNGRRRSLGGEQPSVYAQIGIQFREHLHEFKGARLAVFLAIALHADENGWAYPSQKTLERETGYHRNTIQTALRELCEMTINGHRVLLRYQPRSEGDKFDSNRYLIFPSAEEVEKFDPGHKNCATEPYHKNCGTEPYHNFRCLTRYLNDDPFLLSLIHI